MKRKAFGEFDVYIGKGGQFNFDKKRELRQVSPEELEKITKLFSEHLLKVYYTDSSSYSSCDDDRAGDFDCSGSTYVYKELDLRYDLKGLVMHDGEIVGIVFYVKDGDDIEAKVFYFSNQPKNTMTLGYSASHSSNYITVFKVELVKKGENGAPEHASSISFQKSRTSTSI